MATVSSGSWVGQPSAPGENISNRTRQANQAGQLAALGYIPDSQQQKRTGVDPGAGGYVSGQVPPPGATPGTVTSGTPTHAPSAGAFGIGTSPTQPTVRNGTVAAPIQLSGGTSPVTSLTGSKPITSFSNTSGGGDVTTKTGALSSPAPGGDVTTTTSALVGPGNTVGAGNTGTTRGEQVVPNQVKIGEGSASISPTVNALNQISPGLGDQADIGGKFLSPTQADLSPTIAAQNAAFGLGGNLDQERYNYRPGAAAAQDAVTLDQQKADEIRARQQQTLDALTGAANGTVPSAAELQGRQEAARNVAATLGQARALGGRSAGGAGRNATLASADILSKNRADAAQLRAAEQAQARQALVGAEQGVRGQDIDTAAKQAGLTQEAYANNLRSQLEQNELAEKHRQELLDAQLKAYGIGTNAATSTVGASAANAAADNKFKSGFLDLVGGLV